MTSKSGPGEITTVFGATETALWAAFEKSAVFKHSGTKGDYREDGLAKFLRDQLPGRYGVVKGELIDSKGRRSSQLDIIVFDATRAAPFVRGSKYSGWILPAEAALAVVEVKSVLTKNEHESIAKGTASLHKLRPWGREFAVIDGYREELSTPATARMQYSVFAYKTDLGATKWAQNEVTRAREALSAQGVGSVCLDRVVVLERGMINVAKGTVLSVGEKGILLDWFLTLLNYLEREVQRRRSIPFDEYRPNREESWRRIAVDDFHGSRERREQKKRLAKVAPMLKKRLSG
jgi:hypothetical protein